MGFGEWFWVIYLIIVAVIFVWSFFTGEAAGRNMRKAAGLMIVVPIVFVLNLACSHDKMLRSKRRRRSRRHYW